MEIGVVCCDAGGANQLLAFLSSLSNCNFHGYFVGPASKLYPQYLKHIKVSNEISEVIEQCDVLYTGTSWSSSVEHDARVMAAKIGRRSVTALDHWVNYPDRFTIEGVTQLPDSILTFDESAFIRAKTFFPSVEVVQCESRYLAAISRRAASVSRSVGSYLYICEPFRVRGNNLYDVEQLEQFLFTVKVRDDNKSPLITLRPHPSEPINKYHEVIAKFDYLDVEVDTGDIGTAIGAAEFVVGYASYALYIASKLGRKVLIRNHPENLHRTFSIQEVLQIGTYEILP